MNCPEFQEKILAYDELSPEERYPVDSHVSACVDCRMFFSALIDVDIALTAAFANRLVSKTFSDQLLGKTRTQSRSRQPSMVPEILDAAGWAAIVAAILWLGLSLAPGLEFTMPVAMAI